MMVQKPILCLSSIYVAHSMHLAVSGSGAVTVRQGLSNAGQVLSMFPLRHLSVAAERQGCQT